MHALAMLILLVPMFVALRRGYFAALSCAVFYWVTVPCELLLPLPGALPQLTFHRILVALILIAYLRRRKTFAEVDVRGRTPLFLLAAAYAVSMLASSQNAVSFKATLGFVVEIVVFYVVMARSLQTQSQALQILKVAATGLIVVACLTWIEKYTRINLFERLLAFDSGGRGDITASYRNRILLGYGMAMALPLIILQVCTAESGGQKKLMIAALGVVMAACYFPNSRGPWLGAIIAAAVITLLGGFHVRRVMRGLVAASVLVLVLRPGVWNTICNLLTDTGVESQKGRSYNYRWELWDAAWEMITVSPEKLGLGYGPLSHEKMDLSSLLTMGGNVNKLGYTSFDNHYAASLLELGVVGLGLTAALQATLFASLLWSRRHPALADHRARLANAAVLSGMAVYCFAMTNVYIFAPQLDYLFWTLAACGSALTREQPAEAPADSAVNDAPRPYTPLPRFA